MGLLDAKQAHELGHRVDLDVVDEQETTGPEHSVEVAEVDEDSRPTVVPVDEADVELDSLHESEQGERAL